MCGHKVFNVPFLKTENTKEGGGKKRKMFIYKIGLKVFNVPCLKTENTKEGRGKEKEKLKCL
jgi:hypothetical protein